MSDHPLYGKRKKKISRCPNPLFEKWLQEMREDAADKGIKTQYVYAKALKSLQKYPLVLTSGKDCKMLEYFGDKLCKMLDDKLTRHIAEFGLPDPTDNTTGLCMDEQEVVARRKQSKSKPKVPKNTNSKKEMPHGFAGISADSEDESLDTIKLHRTKTKYQPSIKPATLSHHTFHQISDSDSENEGNMVDSYTAHQNIHDLSDFASEEEEERPPPKKRQKSGEREYVPAYRSGAYAILLALYRNLQSTSSRGYMTKAEITQEAQPLADKSFSMPDPGSRYTSWSSMGTLVKKGLVIKESNPAKYSITDAGCELAHKLESVARGDDHRTAPSPGGSTSSLGRMDTNVMPSVPVPKNTSAFVYSYVTEDGREVDRKDDAAVLIDDDFGVGFLITCKYQKLLGSGKRYKLDTSRPLGDSVYVYLHNDDADERSTAEVPVVPLSNRHKQPACQNTQKQTGNEPKPKAKPKKQAQTGISNVKAPQLLPLMESIQSSDGFSGLKYDRSDSQNSATSSLDSQNSIPSITSCSSTSSLPAPDFILTPGNFEIILCVDNAEYYGSRQGVGKSLLPELVKNGVKCDLRKLQVGDLLWVASKKVPSLPGQLQAPKTHELALDYVIERKRMDDLVHSCTDGRLQDQKFRLKHCGLRRPIFMIEDHGSMQHFSIPEERIRQTITNLKVIDGFQVKRTKDMKESVAYLTVMTRYIQSYYQNKTLISCSPDELREFSNTYDINDREQRLMTFEQFNKGSVKSKNLTVQEMFGKQLIQMHGMSAERAKVITDLYPTISHLVEAYDHCSNTREKEAMLSTVRCNKSMRNLGMNISKQIYQLYCTTGPLT